MTNTNTNADNQYDFVVYGASGFTGKRVCDELQEVIRNAGYNYKWAVAGRSADKLENVLCGMVAKKKLTEQEKSNVGIIVADVNNQSSLVAMCKQTRVVLDCVGPYRLYGEQVIRACILGKADFLDISGEPDFLERMQQKYNDKAKESGIYIVGACGFDSIPSDLGAVFARQQFKGTLNSLECYFTLKFGPLGMKGAYGTYASLVHGLANAESLRKFRKSVGRTPIPKIGPKQQIKGFHWNKQLERYALVFPGADVSIVRRSQSYMYDSLNLLPLQYSMYITYKNIFTIMQIALFLMVLKLFTLTKFGINLLLQYPEIFTLGGFSRKGPSDKQIEQASFTFTMHGEGYSDGKHELNRKDKPDKSIDIVIKGPEIGYVTTPIAMIQAGITMLTERQKLPPNGGAFTTASVFSETTIIERMDQRGLKFEVVKCD